MKRTRFPLFFLLYTTSVVSRIAAQSQDPIAEAKRLRDAHQFKAAADALAPYLKQHPDDAGTHWFRAQLLTWAGLRADARAEYETTLRLSRSQPATVDSLSRYIADLSSSWASLVLKASTDDQPLHAFSVGAEYGRYAAGGATITVDASTARLSAKDEAASLTSGVSTILVGFRANTSLFGADVGAERSSNANSTIPVGDVWITPLQSHGFDITAMASRHGYHYTVASLDTSVAVNSTELGIERPAVSGVAGRVAWRAEHYTGGTTTSIYYGWLLLPIAHGLRIGYSSDARDANQSRWNGAHYDPYYTPENVHVHSAIGEWGWHNFRNAFHASASIGLHARELAPYLLNPSGKSFGFAPRSYSPWNAGVSLTTRVTWHTSLHAEVWHMKTAFYEATSAQLGTTILLR